MKYFHASFFLRQTRFSNFSLKQNKLIFEIFLISPPPEQRAREFGKWWSDVLYFSIKFPHNRMLLAISLLLACFQMKNIRSEAAINFHPLWEALWKPLRGLIFKGMLMWMAWRIVCFAIEFRAKAAHVLQVYSQPEGVSAVKEFEFIMPRVLCK